MQSDSGSSGCSRWPGQRSSWRAPRFASWWLARSPSCRPLSPQLSAAAPPQFLLSASSSRRHSSPSSPSAVAGPAAAAVLSATAGAVTEFASEFDRFWPNPLGAFPGPDGLAIKFHLNCSAVPSQVPGSCSVSAGPRLPSCLMCCAASSCFASDLPAWSTAGFCYRSSASPSAMSSSSSAPSNSFHLSLPAESAQGAKKTAVYEATKAVASVQESCCLASD